nr:unnamed protein product [Digitaria exilis]
MSTWRPARSSASILSDTRTRCWRDPASILGRTLIHFAVDLLDSGSRVDMLSGVRLLDALVTARVDVRSYLMPSRPRIQKLVQALGWREEPASREMREPAARVVAHLAGTIHLAQFPGAIECISSLLHLQEEEETTTWPAKKQTHGGGQPNELILRGLAILEGLTFDHHNCRVICSTPGLLHKIMAPLYSADMIDGISSNRDWANVVSRSLMVLYKLIRVPGKTSRRLRREIYSNRQSMSNLGSILDDADQTVHLQMGALEILTQLALDMSIDLARETKEKLVRKLLHIFLADGEESGGRPVLRLNTLYEERAGTILVLLSTKIESNSALIMTIQNGIIGRLTGILLDPTNTTKYRTIAAQVLENLCNQCDLDKEWVKEMLLPKVLAEILLSSTKGTPKDGVPPPNDEESRQNSEPINHEAENHNISSTAEQNHSSDGESKEQTATAKLLWEPFLSLALAIRDKLISADDFDDAVQKIGLGPGAFVAKMKIIIEENCQETAKSLRIVKLCGRIVEPMMQREQYAQHFRNKEFAVSLSKASKIMSNLESCMLFAGTDFGPRKTTRPLLSDLKKSAQHLVS